MTDRRQSTIAIELAKAVCVTLAVYLVGRLGWVSIPSGEAITLWTPSGIALAVWLVFGKRIGPSVWLGSFLLECTTTFAGAGTLPGTWTDASARSLVFAAILATGMVLQAAAGAWVIRRVLGRIPTLDSLKEVLAFMGLGSLSSAALGVAAHAVCRTADAGGTVHWPSWQADACAELTGLLVFAPLALILLDPRLLQTKLIRTKLLQTRPIHRRPREKRLGEKRLRRFDWPRLLRWFESAVLFVVIPVALWQFSSDRDSDYGVIVFTLSVLWTTLRFGKVGTGLILVVMALLLASNLRTGIPLLGTIRTREPTAITDVQILQGTFSITFWILAAILNERERAAKDLRENEARFRQFSDGMSHIIWMMTADKQRFLYVNRAFERIYGRKRKELYAASELWLAGIHPEDRKRVAESRLACDGAGESCEEYRVVHTDGTVRWLRERSVPLRNEQGEIAMFGGTVEDITQSRAVANELARQQSELLHVSRLSSVGQMVATLSHEVAQPMSAIGTFATVCAKHLQSYPPEGAFEPEKLKQCIEGIASENQRCRVILRRLRDYTRKAPPHRTACDLNAVLRESIDLILHELRRLDIKVRYELTPWLPLVSADQVLLQQVIINLLTNARDAMLHVDPSRRVVVLRSRAEGDCATIEVADQGIGLPAEESSRIFEPFFTTKAEGMGIGLSICKTILEDHGGQIHAFANESGGATFHVVLPSATQEAAT